MRSEITIIALEFISFMCMVVVGCSAHVNIQQKFWFLCAAKMYIASGSFGLYNLIIERGAWNYRMINVFDCEFIIVLNCITTQICLAEGVGWVRAYFILIPTFVDLVSKYRKPHCFPITALTNFITWFILLRLACTTHELGIWKICFLFIRPMIDSTKAYENRYVKALAMHCATLYFIQVELNEELGALYWLSGLK